MNTNEIFAAEDNRRQANITREKNHEGKTKEVIKRQWVITNYHHHFSHDDVIAHTHIHKVSSTNLLLIINCKGEDEGITRPTEEYWFLQPLPRNTTTMCTTTNNLNQFLGYHTLKEPEAQDPPHSNSSGRTEA